jgi:hypothetical protein
VAARGPPTEGPPALWGVGDSPGCGTYRTGERKGSLKGIPSWFIGQVVFDGLGTKAKTNNNFLQKFGFLALVPQASNKNTWPIKNYGIPLKVPPGGR